MHDWARADDTQGEISKVKNFINRNFSFQLTVVQGTPLSDIVNAFSQPPEKNDMEKLRSRDCIFMISVSYSYGENFIYFLLNSRSSTIARVLIENQDQLIMNIIILIYGIKIMFTCHVQSIMFR